MNASTEDVIAFVNSNGFHFVEWGIFLNEDLESVFTSWMQKAADFLRNQRLFAFSNFLIFHFIAHILAIPEPLRTPRCRLRRCARFFSRE